MAQEPSESTPTAVEERERFTRWLRQPETLIGLSAVVLSLCGLGIALYEASIMRAAQRASVWPYVEVSASLSDQHTIIWMQNSGVGPARVEAASLTLGGEHMDGWGELIRRLAPDVDEPEFSFSLANGRVLAAVAEREAVFEITPQPGEASGLVARALQERIWDGSVDVTICYCSVYDECWMSNLQSVIGRARNAGGHAAEQVRSCASLEPSGI